MSFFLTGRKQAFVVCMRAARLVVFMGAVYLVCASRASLPSAGADQEYPLQIREKLDRMISLDLRNMNVVDVYKFLAVKGDFNISISNTIAGRVTLFLKSVSIKDALDIISISNGLAYRLIGDNIIHVLTAAEYSEMFGKKFNDKKQMKIVYLKYAKPSYVLETLKTVKSDIGQIVIDEDTGSVFMIDTEDILAKMEKAIEQMDHPLETRVYSLRYASADDVAAKLKAKIDNLSVGMVQADTRSNQVIVRAFPDRLREVDQLIESLDERTRAVLIDVRIIKIVLNPQYDYGIDWTKAFSESHSAALRKLAFRGAFPISSTVSTVSTLGTVGNIAWGDIDSSEFAVELKFLEQVSETKVLANPSISVENNKEAKIHIGDKLAYVTTTTIGTGESQRVNEEVVFIDVGVKFSVTPTINADGFISMIIKPEISSQASSLTTPQGASIPLVNTTTVETTVIVEDGNTIIIGGLRQDEVTRSDRGIPVLKDIPLLGSLFSNEAEETTQTEIVILLTPHVVSGDENAADTLVEDKEIKTEKHYDVSAPVATKENVDTAAPALKPQSKADQEFVQPLARGNQADALLVKRVIRPDKEYEAAASTTSMNQADDTGAAQTINPSGNIRE